MAILWCASLAGSLEPPAPAAPPLPAGVAPETISRRTLVLALEIDRDGSRLLAYTVKDRPFRRPPEDAGPDSGDGRTTVDLAVRGPGAPGFGRRVTVGPICLLHGPEAEPHVEGDRILLHRDSFLVEAPEAAGLDRVEVGWDVPAAAGAARRMAVVEPLDLARFTRAGGGPAYEDLAFAAPTSEGGAESVETAGTVHWPEEFGDPDIYHVYGDPTASGERINVVIVPDGYTYAQKPLLKAHADALVAHFRGKTPYAEHDPFLNYILVYAYSTQSGTDQCDCGVIVDTAMGTGFPNDGYPCGDSRNRCLYYGWPCDTPVSGNIVAAELRAPARDATIVMVNTTRYGGCGGSRAVYAAGNAYAGEIAVHELGHSLGSLADEYDGDPACGSSASGINTSTNGSTGAWPEWIAETGAPREGAQYYNLCIFRPEANCEMRALNVPFCRVCNQQWGRVIYGHFRVSPTAPVSGSSPASPLDVLTEDPTDFSVTTRVGIGTSDTVTWTLEGPGYPFPTVVATGVGSYSHTFLQAGDYTLTCQVVADANFIKPSKYAGNVDTVAWSVRAIDSNADNDGDGFAPAQGDCDDADPATWPGAPESNDGRDNQCAPGEAGLGIADEITGTLAFPDPTDAALLCWPAQAGAGRYQVARSGDPRVAVACGGAVVTAPCWSDPVTPAPGSVLHYLVRPLRPHAGSWGRTSGGAERTGICGTESVCDDALDDDGDGRIDCADPDCLAAGGCTSVSLAIADAAGDDVPDDGVASFFGPLALFPEDFLRVGIAGGSLIDFQWCSARADFYRDAYLAYGATGGAADSGPWERFHRDEYGGWTGPVTDPYPNLYGDDCGGPWSWCSEFGLGGRGIGTAPAETGLCEAFDYALGCFEGSVLTIQAGVDRLDACGF
jgi:hypothetical protein